MGRWGGEHKNGTKIGPHLQGGGAGNGAVPPPPTLNLCHLCMLLTGAQPCLVCWAVLPYILHKDGVHGLQAAPGGTCTRGTGCQRALSTAGCSKQQAWSTWCMHRVHPMHAACTHPMHAACTAIMHALCTPHAHTVRTPCTHLTPCCVLLHATKAATTPPHPLQTQQTPLAARPSSGWCWQACRQAGGGHSASVALLNSQGNSPPPPRPQGHPAPGLTTPQPSQPYSASSAQQLSDAF